MFAYKKMTVSIWGKSSVCVCVYVYLYVCIYIHIYICMFVCMYLYVYIWSTKVHDPCIDENKLYKNFLLVSSIIYQLVNYDDSVQPDSHGWPTKVWFVFDWIYQCIWWAVYYRNKLFGPSDFSNHSRSQIWNPLCES